MPSSPLKQNLNLYILKTILKKLDIVAQKQGQSRNALINKLIIEFLDKDQDN